MLLTPYLLFNGNCREAMLFYQACLGGELTFQLVEDTPDNYPWPGVLGQMIMQATLVKDTFMLKASDLSDADTIVNGNSVTFMLSCTSHEELKSVMNNLLRGGSSLQHLSLNANGLWLTSLIDKYGHHWTIFCHADGDRHSN